MDRSDARVVPDPFAPNVIGCPGTIGEGADPVYGPADTAPSTTINFPLPSPFSCAGPAGGIAGDCTDGVAFIAEIGVESCFIPTIGSSADADPTVLLEGDFAFYYEEAFAYWTYDGDGSYTGGDPGGAGYGTTWGADGDGSTGVPNDNDPPAPNGPGVPHNGGQADIAGGNAAKGWVAWDNVDTWHGHVAAFIDMSDPVPHVTQGSVVTTQFASWNAAEAASETRAALYGYVNTDGMWEDGSNGLPGQSAAYDTQLANDCSSHPSEDFEALFQTTGDWESQGALVRAP